jgi:hypothetical protein
MCCHGEPPESVVCETVAVDVLPASAIADIPLQKTNIILFVGGVGLKISSAPSSKIKASNKRKEIKKQIEFLAFHVDLGCFGGKCLLLIVLAGFEKGEERQLIKY